MLLENKRKKRRIWIACGIAAVLVAALLPFAMDSRLRIRTYTLETEKISSPVRIGLVTDLHSCYYGEGQGELLDAIHMQKPDVILLGEMRDPETIQTTITAAETGHLIIATLHTKGAVNAIDRIIDSFPSSHQAQIRMMLSMVLQTVVSQQMLPDKDGGMVPAFEIMHVNSAIRSMIRDNKSHQINTVIASGGREGMVTMDQAILELYHRGIITRETALDYADTPDLIRRQMT